MDKLKPILNLIQKHHFWLLCIVAMLVGFVGWMSASRSLSAAYVQKKTNILGKFSALDGVRANEFPPNSHWKEEIDKLTEDEKKKVASAWEAVYNEQKKQLLWPKLMGKNFLDFVESHPPTAEIPYPEIPPPLRDNYRNEIKKELPSLLKIVDAEDRMGSKDSKDKSGNANVPPVDASREYKVKWDEASQKELENLLKWEKAPSSLQVRLAQESLWVYAALLNIIKTVNEGALFIPRIKEINILEIGKPAAAAYQDGLKSGRIEVVASSTPGTLPAEAPAPPALPEGDAAAKLPDNGRYVDADGKSLAGGVAATQQFKRMPIYMKLILDQRQITRLLVACANSTLPVEIRQLRILSSKQGGAGGATSGGSSQNVASTVTDSYDVPVELHGIIYIYNPPSLAALGGAAVPAAPQVQQ